MAASTAMKTTNMKAAEATISKNAKIATKAPVEPIPAALHARGAIPPPARPRRAKKTKEALAFRCDQERRYAAATKVQDALLAT